MTNNYPHNWDVSIPEARKIQAELREALVAQPLPEHIRTVAGADVSFNKFEKDVYAGIIVLSYPDLVPIEHAVVKMEVNFPYVPGFLSFREIPPLLACWEKLKTKPDVIVVDGHGIAHPRRLGIAAHFGLMVGKPTIGAAKNMLYGYNDPVPETPGLYSYIIDQKNGEKLGVAMRTKNKVKPMLFSPGNLADVESTIAFMKTLVRKYRLPEPTRRAHELVNKFRTGEITE